jgi:hypothetical protein
VQTTLPVSQSRGSVAHFRLSSHVVSIATSGLRSHPTKFWRATRVTRLDDVLPFKRLLTLGNFVWKKYISRHIFKLLFSQKKIFIKFYKILVGLQFERFFRKKYLVTLRAYLVHLKTCQTKNNKFDEFRTLTVVAFFVWSDDICTRDFDAWLWCCKRNFSRSYRIFLSQCAQLESML